MNKTFLLFFILTTLISCEPEQNKEKLVINSDIELFWAAYDRITQTQDSLEQVKLLQELYLSKGSPGLKGIIDAKNYTIEDFIHAINHYPKFWKSIRANTLKSSLIEDDLIKGIEKLRKIYPELKPAKIYFTIGAMRSNGTTLDSLVLIGSEYAMADQNTDTSEFPEAYRAARKTFFDSNPIDNLVLLNIHEYVHTQQKPIVHNLLFQCLYEGVAEFVSVKAMGVPSASPAIAFGKANEQKVKEKFEKDMFFDNKTYEWIWGDAKNGFGVRDLGYYIGYEICERYYNSQKDKKAAIKTLIELDYEPQESIEEWIDKTQFFSKPIQQLHDEFEAKRPTVLSIEPFSSDSTNVNPKTTQVTLHFSTPMNKETRGFDFGPLGEDHVLRVKKLIGFSEGGRSFTFEVALEPNRKYQSLVTNRFLSEEGIPLKPYLINIQTAKE